MTEKDLEKICGKGNPFSVPDGYFEQFSHDILNKVKDLPQTKVEQPKAKVVRFRPWMAVAACFCVAVFALSIFLNKNFDSEPMQTAQNTELVSDTYDEDVAEYAEYAMLDNGDLYACIYGE